MRKTLLALAFVLAACATPPGAPPSSPREIAEPILITYGSVLVLTNTAVHSPQLQTKPDIVRQIQASSHAASAAVLAYADAANLCFRDPNTLVVGDAIGNPPGKHCDPTQAAGLQAAAQAALNNTTSLLAAFGFTLPVPPPKS